jgi:hypothetical protein
VSGSDFTSSIAPPWWDGFIQRVCELPDRSSPDDDPDAIVATEQELLTCYLCTIEDASERSAGAGGILDGTDRTSGGWIGQP